MFHGNENFRKAVEKEVKISTDRKGKCTLSLKRFEKTATMNQSCLFDNLLILHSVTEAMLP